MRRAEIVTAVLLGILSIYLMWKSGEPPSWNPDVKRFANVGFIEGEGPGSCLLYTSPSPRDLSTSRMPSSA